MRVEIGRLRRQLDAWYAGPGAQDALRITIPRGQSRPVLQRQTGRRSAPVVAGRRRALRLAALGVLALAIIWLAVILILPRISTQPTPVPSTRSGTPLIEVAGITGENIAPGLRYLGSGLQAQLLRNLVRSGAVQVRDNHAGQDTNGLIPADYMLHGTLYKTAEGQMLEVFLSGREDGIVVYAGQILIDPDDPTLPVKIRRLVNAMLLEIVDPSTLPEMGSPKATESGETDFASASQFACHLRFHAWDESKDPALESDARDCLTHWVEAGSEDGMIWAGYALMLMLDWSRDGADPQDHRIVEAESAARRAVSLAPDNTDAHQALASLLIAVNSHEEARAELEKAIALNPFRPDLQVLLGWIMAEQGDWARAVAQVRKGLELAVVVPGWYRIPLALDALRRGADGEALEQAQQMIAAHDGRGQIIALAAAIRLEDAAATQRAREAIRSGGQSVAQALSALSTVFANAQIEVLLRDTLARDMSN